MVRTIAQLIKNSITVPAENAKFRGIAVSLKPKISSYSSAPMVAIAVPEFSTMYGSTIVDVIN